MRTSKRLLPRSALRWAVAALVPLFAAWIAVSEAHELRGWRTLLLPVLFTLIIVVGGWALGTLFTGGEFSLNALAQLFGFVP